MPFKLSVSVRNARGNAIESTIGANATLRLRSGAPPADCAAARTGTVIATMALGADWMAAAANGVTAKSGTWQDLSADAAGTIGHFEIVDSAGTTCHAQGTVTLTGGGGDMTVDNTNVQAGQSITVTGFTLTEGNA